MEEVQFTVVTDQLSFNRLLNIADATGQKARWRLIPQVFEFEERYRDEIEHSTANALSRRSMVKLDDLETDKHIPILYIEYERKTRTKLRKEVRNETIEENEHIGEEYTGEKIRTTVADQNEPRSTREFVGQ